MTTPATPAPPSPRRVLVCVAVLVTVGWLGIVVFWKDAPFALTFDDAFYYFGIARNVAAGHGSTFDGINATNGYHPLWMLMAVPVYALGLDGTGAIRVLLVVQVLCYGSALAMVATVAGRAIGRWPGVVEARGSAAAVKARWCATALVALGFAVTAANPYTVRIFVNGLESGVVVALDASLLVVAAGSGGRFLSTGSPRGRWALGCLLGLVVLARTDSLLVVGALAIWCLAEARPLGARGIRPLAELFTLPIVVFGGYLVSNQVWFGVAVQISGLTKQAPITVARLSEMALVVVGAVGIGVWGRRRIERRRPGALSSRFPRSAAFAADTSWFVGSLAVIVAYYQVLQTQQWLWYYCPLAIWLLFVMVLGVADFCESAIIEAGATGPIARSLLPIAVILLAPLLVGLWVQTRAFVDPGQRSIEIADRDAGEWIHANLPAGSVLASWDAGVVGYYAHGPVMNLDGVASSYAYYRAGRNATVGRFLAERGLTGIVNHGTPVNGEDPEIRAFLRSTFGSGTEGRAHMVRRWPFVFSGTTTGSAGRGSGTRELAVFLYALPVPLPTGP